MTKQFYPAIIPEEPYKSSSCSKLRIPAKKERILPQEEGQKMAGQRGRAAKLIPSSHARAMSKALGIAAIIIVLAIFLPSVLNALENFLLLLLQKATEFVRALPAAAGPADIHQYIR